MNSRLCRQRAGSPIRTPTLRPTVAYDNDLMHPSSDDTTLDEAQPVIPKSLHRARTYLVLGICSVMMLAMLFTDLKPALLIKDTTANGGDMGAHVWWPKYLHDHVFSTLRLSGWTPDWYAGFPVGHFYFPVAAIIIGILDILLPYNVAFKLVTVLGPVLMMYAAAYLARGLRMRWPAPAFAAMAALFYLYFTGNDALVDAGGNVIEQSTFRITGGNLASVLAGEFSFAIALAMSMFFLGALSRALDERRRYWMPMVLLAVTVLGHVIVAIFVSLCALVIVVARGPIRNFRPAVTIGVGAFLLSSIWTLPLVADIGYTTDMGWGRVREYGRHLLPYRPGQTIIIVALVFCALLAAMRQRRRSTVELFVLLTILGFAFVTFPDSQLWNARILPFWWLILLMVAAAGAAEVVRWVWALGVQLGERFSGRDDEPLERSPVAGAATAWGSNGTVSQTSGPPAQSRAHPVDWVRFGAVGVVVVICMGILTAYLIGIPKIAERGPDAFAKETFIDDWATWNYSGYEDKGTPCNKSENASEVSRCKPGQDTKTGLTSQEFFRIMEDMGTLEPGRALWEPSGDINNYGTTLALELLPYFTDGRIGSMEGLYFESSGTVPYHFQMVSELAQSPSNPVRDLTYGTLADNFDRGVEHLHMLGVRYLMLQSPEAMAKADVDPDLTVVLDIPDLDGKAPDGWRVYEVSDTTLVAPLEFQPVVVTGVSAHGWRDPASEWFMDDSQLDRFIAADGPSEWERVDADAYASAPRVPLPDNTVTDVVQGREDISFKVSNPGVPVLVRTSYFPNWKVSGADGPYRAGPNLMVVVPTSNEVSLSYGRTIEDYLGYLGTLLGLVLLVYLVRAGRRGPIPFIDGGRHGTFVAPPKPKDGTDAVSHPDAGTADTDLTDGSQWSAEGQAVGAPPVDGPLSAQAVVDEDRARSGVPTTDLAQSGEAASEQTAPEETAPEETAPDAESGTDGLLSDQQAADEQQRGDDSGESRPRAESSTDDSADTAGNTEPTPEGNAADATASGEALADADPSSEDAPAQVDTSDAERGVDAPGSADDAADGDRG